MRPLPALFAAAAVAATARAEEETLLLRDPAVSASAIAFVHAGDLWTVGQDGGVARRLTIHPGIESSPCFAPDGRTLAFTGSYDGNRDVYTMPADGGAPRRLTFHPEADDVNGFTPDGSALLFASGRAANGLPTPQFFTIPVAGGFETPLPLPMVGRGGFAPDGRHLVYAPIAEAFGTWKRYRGGMKSPLWICDLTTLDVEEIPSENSNDAAPLWLGDTIWFLSDRAHTMNLFACDAKTRAVRQVTRHDDFDVKSFGGAGDTIVYEQAGRLHRLDAKSGRAAPLSIRVPADLPETRPHAVPAARFLADAGLSPNGVRAVFEARGELLTVPAKKGDVRNVTRTPGVCERSPAWSPDGRSIACFSDAGGEYHLEIRPQDGLGEARTIALGDPPSFYYAPRWSPDGKHLCYTDKRLNVWFVEAAGGAPVLVDTDTYDHPVRSLDPGWSPDGKWIVYTKRLPNHFRAVFLYDVELRRATQLSDGRGDAASAVFSLDGKYIHFLASTNFGLNVGWLDMSSFERPVRSAIYVVVLAKDAPSPLAPESDDEKGEVAAAPAVPSAPPAAAGAATPPAAGAETKLPTVKIDFEGIDQRILALPAPARNYANLQAAAEGRLFAVEVGDVAVTDRAPPAKTLWRWDPAERKFETFLAGLGGGFRMAEDGAYWVSANGKKLLYAAGETWGIVDTAGPAKAGDGALPVAGMTIDVDPRAEWSQMYEEVCRIERDFFYVANMHGADWPAVSAKYRPFVAHAGHRSDLNYIVADVIGELVVGHAYVFGGDEPESKGVPGGLLGCDFAVEEGGYRITRILSGLNWNPHAQAPLTQPGVKAAAGDWLLAVNGRPVAPPQNVHAALLGTVGKQTVLKLGKSPQDPEAWTTTVVPIADESELRRRAWIEGNRRKVDELTEGRVAYVYMPDTSVGGYTGFNRDYYAHLDREAVIIDERFNGGGSVADYVIDMLRRPLLSMWATREGRNFPSPAASIFGPKVMIINQYAGSGGDAMPLMFRRAGLGKLVGKRTWGGLVGIYDYPTLMDGGQVMAPRLAIYSPEGEWEVENVGVPPDLDVELLPRLVKDGRDPQLETAVKVVLEELAKSPVKLPPRPADPVRVR